MFTQTERLIAVRNLRPKRKQGFLKIISLFSFLGIMLGVAILIIVMSVMNGFRSDLTEKIIGLNPHLILQFNNEKDLKKECKMKEPKEPKEDEKVKAIDTEVSKEIEVSVETEEQKENPKVGSKSGEVVEGKET